MLAAGIVLATAACADAGTEEKGTRKMSRIGMPELPAIVFENRKYDEIRNGGTLGLRQRTGYVSVIDTEKVELLFLIKIYDVVFDPDIEADVQDVFFTRMELDAAARRIVIENERGGRFALDLDSLEVSPLD